MAETEQTIPSRIEAIEKAWDTEAAKLNPPSETGEPAAESTESGTEPALPSETADATAAGESTPTGERARDERGRFAKGTAIEKSATDGASAAPAAESPGTADKAAAVPRETQPHVVLPKPPPSWRAAAREKWAALPPEVQQEAIRRETETSRTLNESAQARQGWETFRRVAAPYEGMFRQQNVDPLQGFQILAQTYHELQYAPPQRKVAILANLISSHLGTDEASINLLAAALSGQPAQGAPQQPSFDPAAFKQELLGEFRQMGELAASQAGARQMEEFIATEPEFLEDVRETMADIIDVDRASKNRLADGDPRKFALSPEEAYARACQMHPEVSQVMRQREEARARTAQNEATQRAKAAAATLKGESPGVTPRDNSRLAEIARAWDLHASGGSR